MFGQDAQSRIFEKRSEWFFEGKFHSLLVYLFHRDPFPIYFFRALDERVAHFVYGEKHIVGCHWLVVLEEGFFFYVKNIREPVFGNFVALGQIRDEVAVRSEERRVGKEGR